VISAGLCVSCVITLKSVSAFELSFRLAFCVSLDAGLVRASALGPNYTACRVPQISLLSEGSPILISFERGGISGRQTAPDGSHGRTFKSKLGWTELMVRAIRMDRGVRL
jgi:hypothetical protein